MNKLYDQLYYLPMGAKYWIWHYKHYTAAASLGDSVVTMQGIRAKQKEE